MDDELMRVYRAANAIEAHLLKGMLEQSGIQVWLAGECLAAGVGELPANVIEVELRVRRRDAAAARRLIEACEARAGVNDNHCGWQCRMCLEQNPRGFDLCWNCRAPRDAAGA